MEKRRLTATANIENWKYKNAAELEALADDVLHKEAAELHAAIRLFRQHDVPMTDEMFWLMVAISNEKRRRRKSA